MARNALIQVRRDTAANWTSTNPTLAAGEMGFETDTGKLKIGTGSTAWTSLLYATDASDITGTTLASNVTGSSLTSVGTLGSLAVTNATTSGTFAQGTDYLSPYQGFRNKAINGGFDIWQRGTSFSNPAPGSYIADRTSILYDGSGATRTISQGQFDPYVSGASITATPPTGTSPTYFLRYNQSVAGSGATYNILYINRTEDVRVLAGKTITVSFYAKAAASLTIGGIYFEQVFGSGGSPSSNVYSTISGSTSVTTSWQRFSYTVAVPSASGKVIGSSANSSYTGILMYLPINTTFTLDIWGLQIEEGSVATPFEQRPIGTELALCQRYYWRTIDSQNVGLIMVGGVETTGLAAVAGALPVTMRVTPSISLGSGIRFYSVGTSAITPTINSQRSSPSFASASLNITSGTVGQAGYLYNNPAANSFIEFSSEL